MGDMTPSVGDWVVFHGETDPDFLNPILGQDAYGAMIDSYIFDSMLTMDNYTLKLKPQLAESYDISDDHLVYTFHLRHDVKWHDGQPFTADDVKFTFDRVQDPKVDAAQMRVDFINIKSCEVLDPYTIRFTATERYYKTLEAVGTLPIVPRHAFEKGDPDFNKNNFARQPFGTGPYKFVRWDTGSQIVLERNDDYWDKTRPDYPRRLVYQIIQEPYVAVQLLKKGEIDLIENVNPLQYERELVHSASMKRLHRILYDYPAYSYMGFNLRNPIFADVRVRHAIDLLIPRDEILTKVYLNEYASKTSGYGLPASAGYNHDVPPTPNDPARARQLLTEAGWKDDHGDGLLYKDGKPLSFTLSYPNGSTNSQKFAELAQEAFRRAGIEMKLSRMEWALFLEREQDWKFDASLQSWALGVESDPYQIWHGSQADIKKSSNFIGYKNPAADKLIEAARLEYDDAKRAAMYRQLHQIIHDDYPVCFLFNPRYTLVASDRFQDVKTFAPRPCFDMSYWWTPRALQKYGN